MKHYTLHLDDTDLAVIAAALGELPLKVSKPTFDKINQQVAQQAAPPAGQDHAVGGTD